MVNVKNCCESVLRTGFGTIEMSSNMLKNFERLTVEFPKVDASIKSAYSDEHDTDGFLPFGSEYARIEGQPDLCERFCYWHTHASKRRLHPFGSGAFVSAAAAYEAEVSELAQQLLDAICGEFGAMPLASVRSSSYLQLCVYGRGARRQERQFAQDPHEDGHMLSFIKPNRDGLVLVRGRALDPVRLLENELAVLSGSLLTEFSDCAIPAAYHAVMTPSAAVDRSSLIYFVNPDASQPLVGLRRGRPVNLSRAMNARHEAFGNQPLQIG